MVTYEVEGGLCVERSFGLRFDARFTRRYSY